MEPRLIWIIARRELVEALKNKWLAVSTIGFAVLAFALSRTSLASAGYAGLGGFGRTAASLVNALMLYVPLIGLAVGAGTLAGDIERGSLRYLLAQPVSKAEIFLGKLLGALLAISLGLFAGFGVAAFALASAGGGDPASFINMVAYALLLTITSLGIGFMVSASARKHSAASGAALLVWLGLVFFADLALIGVTLRFRPTASALLSILVLNPLQVFKMGAIYGMRSNLDVLGAVGQYAVYHFGERLPWLLVGLLLAWAFLGFTVAYLMFVRQTEI